jgi:hypothetical protein
MALIEAMKIDECKGCKRSFTFNYFTGLKAVSCHFCKSRHHLDPAKIEPILTTK